MACLLMERNSGLNNYVYFAAVIGSLELVNKVLYSRRAHFEYISDDDNAVGTALHFAVY